MKWLGRERMVSALSFAALLMLVFTAQHPVWAALLIVVLFLLIRKFR